MDLAVWISLFVIFFAGGLTPGPAVMHVVATSLRRGFGLAMLPAVGVSAANLLWISLAALGVVALAATVPGLFVVLKGAGLLFILWLAWKTVQAGSTDLGKGAASASVKSGLFASGVALQLANPNALVFFGFILPAYFDPAKPLLPQVLVIMLTVTATEMTGLAVYAGLSRLLSRRFQDPKFANKVNWFAAALMVGSAIFAVWATR